MMSDADPTPHRFNYGAPDTCRNCGNGREHPVHVDDHPVTTNPVVAHETGNVSDKLRTPQEVWEDAYRAWDDAPINPNRIGDDDKAAAAIIEADRQATRAALVREIVAWLRTASNGSDTTKYANVFADEIEAKWGK